jgi:hypothetical protein
MSAANGETGAAGIGIMRLDMRWSIVPVRDGVAYSWISEKLLNDGE